jgi:hypothetical protein
VNTTSVVEVLIIAGSIVLALAMVVGAWQLASARKARAAVTSGKEYRGLAEEYRRLAEMAVTTQEHTDLKLGEITMRIDEVRDQLESVQRILKEVE